jgi:NAD(P)-dependent dehydrogenase (short-subunit alcohol dehydrogenase family)
MIELAGKTALITGGGGGLGEDMAMLFAKLGARVGVADLDEARARAVADRLGEFAPRALAVKMDVADDGAVAAAVEIVKGEFGRIDILINNAAATGQDIIGQDRDLLATDLSVWDRTMAINLRGTMLVSRHVLPVMIAAGDGAIVNIASRQGIAPSGSGLRHAYSVSKAGMIMLSRHIATAYGKKGIRSNTVAPGVIATERMLTNLDPARLAQSKSNVLTPYLGTPADISRLVAFLVSDAGRYITGQTLQVDGGVLTYLHD